MRDQISLHQMHPALFFLSYFPFFSFKFVYRCAVCVSDCQDVYVSVHHDERDDVRQYICIKKGGGSRSKLEVGY